jgi:NAD(P)-dependent dehydrogenase (short-subunit alcohol dehydrogenase family)
VNELAGKIAWVTGAGTGIGEAAALALAREGMTVVLTGRRKEPLEKAAAAIAEQGGKAVVKPADLTNAGKVKAVVDAIRAELGRIDVLVNNAGIAPVPPSLLEVTPELFDKTIAVNLRGPLRLTALAAEHMPPGGAVINISSKASLLPTAVTVVYAAAKAGLNAFTKAAANELAPRRIRVNAIVCGTFHTDSFHASVPTADLQAGMATRVALGRIASADEIVGTALFLASEASAYMTGELLVLDGG